MHHQPSPRQLIVTILLVILAAIPRLYALNLMEYQTDEAQTVHYLYNALHHGHLTPTGLISSIGVHNPPLFIYLLLPVAFISTDPVFIATAIAIINAILVGLLYNLLKKFYPDYIILGASILLATAPWAIILSRKIWAQDLILLFTIPIFYLLHRLNGKPQPKIVIIITLLLSLNAQLHLSGLFFALAIATQFLKEMKANFKPVLLGFALSLLPLLPYVHDQLSQSPRCPDCQALVFHLQSSSNHFDFRHLTLPPQLLTGLSWSTLLGFQPWNAFSQQFPINQTATYMFVIVSLAVYLGIYTKIKNKSSHWLVQVPLVFLTLMFITKTPAFLPYYQNLLPFFSLFAVLGLNRILNSHRSISYSCLIVIATVNLIFTFSFFRFIQKNPITDGDYGPAYAASSTWVNQAASPYVSRKDFDDILLAAHFSIQTLPIKTLADVEANVAFYFTQTGETSLAEKHLSKARNLEPQSTRYQSLVKLLQ